MRFFHRTRLAAVIVVLAAVSGCSDPGRSGQAAVTAPDADLTVFAASSLTDVVETFNREYDGGGRLRINVGSSAALVSQLQSGAHADVVITADTQSLEALAGSGIPAAEQTIAGNRLVLALAAGNSAGISALEDISAPGIRIAACAPSVPCGRAADRVLAAAGQSLAGESREDNARSVLTKVATGQADAGFVYRTDALAAAGQGVTYLPLEDPEPNQYPAVLTAEGAKNDAAVGFYDWLTGPDAAAILQEAGFDPPAGS